MSIPVVTQGANATPAPPATTQNQPNPQAGAAAVPPAAQPGATPAVPEKKEGDPFAQRFAALSRQEKALREQQSTWKAQREAESKAWSEKIEKAKRVEDLKARAKTDRTAALELMREMDLSYDDLTKLHLNGGKPTPEMLAEEAKRETKAIRDEIDERDKKAQEREEQAKQERIAQAVQHFKGQIGEHLKSKPDDYELTLNYADPVSGSTGADLVYQVIDEHYNETEKETGTGRVMSHEEAAKIVEDYLEKEYEEKVLTRKKIQAKLGKAPGGDAASAAAAGSGNDGAIPGGDSGASAAAAGAVPPSSRKPVVTRTLTNADQTQAGTQPSVRPKTRDESLREAAKLLRWSQG